MLSSFDDLKTPLQAFYHWEKERAQSVYMRQPLGDELREYTWAEVGSQARRMAAYLRSLELPPGSHIGLFSKNCPHWIMADLAIWMAGHVSVPLYPSLNGDTINYTLTHGDCKLCFVGRLDNFEKMRDGIPADLPCIGFPYETSTDFPQWDDVIAGQEPIADNPTRNLDEICTIIYTSGTTGNPKGVVHKFMCLSYAITGILQVFPMKDDDRLFSYLPMSHVAERGFVELCSLYTGATVTFSDTLATFAANLRDGAPTLFLGVPRIWTKFQEQILKKFPQKRLERMLKLPILGKLVKRKVREALGLSHCRYGFSGAAPITQELVEWYKALDIEILEAYGMTENFAYSHFTFPGTRKPGYIGQAVPNADVVIGEGDEILVKSPCTMVGYYKEPEKTAETMHDGYLRTGDQGALDSEGFLKITGRIKDLFKTAKGKYVAPSPIEMKFEANALVEQICLIGVDIPQPIALIQLSEIGQELGREEAEAQLTELMNAINPTLDGHERVSNCVVCAEPWTVENKLLTPTMKIKRNVVEQTYAKQAGVWCESKAPVIWE